MNKPTERDLVIAKKVGKFKLIKATTKLYNSLCVICKHKVIRNPKLDLKDYCSNCKPAVKEFEEKFKGVLK